MGGIAADERNFERVGVRLALVEPVDEDQGFRVGIAVEQRTYRVEFCRIFPCGLSALVAREARVLRTICLGGPRHGAKFDLGFGDETRLEQFRPVGADGWADKSENFRSFVVFSDRGCRQSESEL